MIKANLKLKFCIIESYYMSYSPVSWKELLGVDCPSVYMWRGSSFKYAKPSISLKALCCHVIFISVHVHCALVWKKRHIMFGPLLSQSAIECVFYHVVLVKLHVFLALLLASAHYSHWGKSSFKRRKQCYCWKVETDMQFGTGNKTGVQDLYIFSRLIIC